MKEKILELLKDKKYKERSIQDLSKYFNQNTSEEYKEFIKLMNELEDNGEVIRDSNNNYYLINDLGYFKGIIQITKAGYGFVRVNEDEEYYVSKDHIHGCYDGDEVLVNRLNKFNKEHIEAVVIKVLKRNKNTYVGEVKQGKKSIYVLVDLGYRILRIDVDHAHLHGAMVGHKVLVEIKTYKPKLKGNIVKIIGHINDPGTDILSIVYAHGSEVEFSKEVYDYIKNIDDTIDYQDLENRVDLREEVVVTIDGDSAKDLDDAISLKVLDNGNYQLGVHIADVSYYVEEGSVLDKEAFNRGTSIYIVDRVIPMLPHKLSNGICSLNPNVDRYTISCIMEIDNEGNVVDHQILPTVINSNYRMTYTNVNKILDGDMIIQEQYQDVISLFFRMQELASILNRKRSNHGSIDFDTKEAQIIVDKQGKPLDVVLRQRGISDRIIEEFMLISNVTIASHFKWLDLPFIYRVHEFPKSKKLLQFQKIIKPLGYTIKGSLDNVHPKELKRILQLSEGKTEHDVISTLLLRCMQKARYDQQCLGHYGLSFDYYTHFTSPIRRYPDLIVHRLIRKYLFEQRLDLINHYQQIMPEIAIQSSNQERKAIEIEREVDDMKMAEYMSYHIGEVYEGVISSITRFGLFVELDNTIDGLIHISELDDDYYYYDEELMMLLGERTGKIYKISDKVKVKVIKASKQDKTIDFKIIGRKKKTRKKKRSRMY